MSLGVPAAQVVRGPYLQIKTPTNIVVRWRTDVPTDSRVQFGTDAGNLDRAVEMSGTRTNHELTAADVKIYYWKDVNEKWTFLGLSTDIAK